MPKIYIREGIEYTASNHRMKYNPEFHENHGKPFTVKELAFLCSSWEGMKKADIAMALGRTHGTVLSKAYELKRKGQFEYFKKRGHV
ncbi:DNA-entry nuclease [Neobacillus sp. NPDC093127]|uniref:DNA-entry nuclease n=1 Tax=Neobacillus sp. NPDC093127 TaxID=3364296 RepID=UPI00381A28B4